MLNHENKKRIFQVDDNTNIKASLARLHKRLDDMSLKREFNATNEVELRPHHAIYAYLMTITPFYERTPRGASQLCWVIQGSTL